MVGRSVNRQFSTPGFVVAVLFFSEYKNHYVATHFWKKWFLYKLQTPAFWFSQISGIFTDSPTRFFFPGRPVNVKCEYFRWSPLLPLVLPTIFIALSLFLSHHRCLLYKQVLLGIFRMNSLVIIKCLFDLEITYENKNASTEIQQSLLNDNFTMHTSCSIVDVCITTLRFQARHF